MSGDNLERHLGRGHKKPASATLPLPAPEEAVQIHTNASLPLPSSLAKGKNVTCLECGWKGKSKSVLTRHINGIHKK